MVRPVQSPAYGPRLKIVEKVRLMKITVVDSSTSTQRIPVYIDKDSCCAFCEAIIDGEFSTIPDGSLDVTKQ